MSKILFVFLIGCVAVFASPISRESENSSSEYYDEESDELTAVGSIIKRIFGNLLGKIGGAVKDSLQVAFEKIGEKLDTKEYREAVQELKEILQTVFNDDDEIEGDDETKKIIEQELQKVSEAFEELLKHALKNIEQNNDEKVDAKNFKKAVEDLKKVVDTLYAE